MIKLTETQIKVLGPLLQAKQKAEMDVTNAVFLIAGKEFKSFSIQDGMLIIQDDIIDDDVEQ